MEKKIFAQTEMLIKVQPGTKVTIEYDNPSDVSIVSKIQLTDNYEEREVNLLQFIHHNNRLKYLDKVVDMYNSLSLESKTKVIDAMEWTKYKRDYFIRDFIDAVNHEYSRVKK
jgi:hypothetical protein